MTWHIPLGPFELREPIGKGGMGEVWYGVHVPQQVGVAVKVLKAKGTKRQEYVDAFLNEVRAVAALDHPAVIIPLDYGEIPQGTHDASEGRIEAGSPFIVMEHARRGSLKRFQQVIGWRETKLVLFTILDALAHAHAAGVIHRDLKPANILVGCNGTAPGIKLTDFGLARASDSFERPGTTETGWGTPAYMAPEQFRGRWRDYGPWTDLYALGVMAYELTCGSQPFHADSNGGFARAHALLPPRKFEPAFSVPEGFQAWLMRLLQKEPSDRFQRAADAAWGLQLLGDPPPVSGSRKTVTLMPIVVDEVTESTQNSSAGILNTPQRPISSPDPNPTEVDRPGTTALLVEEDIEIHTHSLNASNWDVNSNDSLEFTMGNLAKRLLPPLPYTWKRPRNAPPATKLLGAGLGLFGLRALRIVGREVERDHLWAQLKNIRRSGEPHALILRGAAGTGKTKLALWTARRAHEVGSAVFFLGTHSPIGGPRDGLTRMIARELRCIGLTREETYERLRAKLPSIGLEEELDWRAFTELLAPLDPGDAAPGGMTLKFSKTEQRFALIRRYLLRATRSRPAVMVLDDVQWGGESLAFANYILDRADYGLPLLMILTAREEALAERPVEEATLEFIGSKDNVETQVVGPLNHEETELLVRELLYLDEGVAREVERRCGGNPLFAWQLVADLVARGKLQFGAAGFEIKPSEVMDIPDDIHELWLRRLEGVTAFSEGVFEALEVAAALGGNIDLREWFLACRTRGLSASRELVTRLINSGMAVQTEDGWEFCHGMLRESLERHAHESGRWVEHNLACVEMLTTTHPDRLFPHSERIATHYLAAEAWEDATIPLQRSVTGRLALSDFKIALQHIERCEWLVGKLASGNRFEIEIWLLKAQVRVEQGQLDEAVSLSEKAAIEARRQGWAEMVPPALLIEGQAQLAHGQLEQAKRTFERAREAYSRLDDLDGLADCALGLARVHQYKGSLSFAREALTEAQMLYEQGHNDLGTARALNARGDIDRAMGELKDAKQHTNEALVLFRSLGNQMGVADCTNDLAELSRMLGDLEAALNSCESAISIYRSLGSDQAMIARQNLALVLMQFSRYTEAREVLEDVREHFQRTRQWGLLAATNLYLLPVLGALVEWEQWEERLEDAQTMLDRTGYWEPDMGKALAAAARGAEKGGQMTLSRRAAELRREHARGQ